MNWIRFWQVKICYIWGYVVNLLVILCYIGESRRNWPKYDDSMAGRDMWTSDLINSYIQQLKLDMKNGRLNLKHNITPEVIAGSLIER